MKTDLIIVGGGIIGLYSAYTLASRGLRITLCDKGQLGGECSSAAGGILSTLLPWDYPPAINQLISNVTHEYEELSKQLLASTAIDIQLWRCGLHATLKAEEHTTALNWCKNNNADYSSREGCLRLEQVAQLEPLLLIKALHTRLQQLDVTILENTQVDSVTVEHDKVSGIHTSRGFMPCERLLWTTGAWAKTLSANQDCLEAPAVRPIKGQMIVFKAEPELLKQILYHAGHYLIPRKNGLILAGSTLENSGFDQAVTQHALQLLKHKSIDLLPPLKDCEIVQHWSGLRPYSETEHPIIAEHDAIKGLYLNCGHHRYGICMAPHSARRIARLILA